MYTNVLPLHSINLAFITENIWTMKERETFRDLLLLIDFKFQKLTVFYVFCLKTDTLTKPTNQLTTRSRVCLEKLTATQLVKKFPTFYGTQTQFTRACRFWGHVTFCNKLAFYDEELLAPCPTPKLEDHPLLAVHDYFLSIYATTLHIWRSSPPSTTRRHAMLYGICLTIWVNGHKRNNNWRTWINQMTF
jgi:hypothetical protein